MNFSEELIDNIIEALDNADYELRYYFNGRICCTTKR